MSKKKAGKRQKSQSQKLKSRSRRKSLIVIALILCLGLTSLILAQWRSVRSPFGALSPSPQPSPTPQLSKEYIYAGGRLIATEEPTGGGSSPLSAPTGLTATATPSAQISLSWTASTGGTVDHYQVERCQNFAPNCYSVVAANVPTINYSDTTVSAGSAYLYRVRAVDTAGNFSNYSSIDLATAITFLDDPLSVGTAVKAQHITELRQAINAVRTVANLSGATWDNSVQPGDSIRAIDIQELRNNLDQARSALGLTAMSYTDPTLSVGTTLIRKDHINELRQGVK